MRVLVTAGNTQTLIDEVRCITNVFSGRTGGAIALEAHARGHDVTLVTSHPESVNRPVAAGDRWRILPYRTFDELRDLMATLIPSSPFDCIIHCAAVSDYRSEGTFAAAPGTCFDRQRLAWLGEAGPPVMMDVSRGKLKSSHPELWLRLIPTEKLIDRMRGDWGFRGVLVKFKLEVGVADDDLLAIAEESRRHSQADLMAANTLEGMHAWAFLGPVNGQYERVERGRLAARLLDEIERLAARQEEG